MLTFNPETHEYALEGKHIPGVNEILKAGGILPNFNFPQAEYKRQLGTYVHQAIKMYFEDNLDEDSLQSPIKEYFEGFKKFHKENPINPLEVEKILYSKKWGFAGTTDCFDNKLYDWKVSASIYDTYYLSMAGYEILVEEHLGYKPEEVIIVQLKPNGYKPHTIKPDRQNFLAFLMTYKYKQKKGLL